MSRWWLAGLPVAVLSSGCGAAGQDVDALAQSFTGKLTCTGETSFDCGCVQMNSLTHQRETGMALLKCSHQANFDKALENPFCLNRDPQTGLLRSWLSLEGCPWTETPEEAARLLASEN